MATNIFELQKKRAAQKANTAQQTGNESLKRRFAQMGALNSGAAIKQEQILGEDLNKQLGDELEGIGAQEQEFTRQKEEVEEGRKFAAGEAEKQRGWSSEENKMGRDFSAGESALGRAWQSSEALAGRQFAAGESALGRQFAAGESALGRQFAAGESALDRALTVGEAEKQRGWASEESKAGRDFAASESLKARTLELEQRGLDRDQAAKYADQEMQFKNQVQEWNKSQAGKEFDMLTKQFELDKENTAYNRRLSTEMAGKQGADVDFLTSGQRPKPAKNPKAMTRKQVEDMTRRRVSQPQQNRRGSREGTY